MADFTEFLSRAIQNVENARTMKGKKPPVRASKENLVALHQQVLLKHTKDNQTTGQLAIHQTITTLTYPPCTEPLSSLQRISLSDLVLETVHHGKFVLCKTFVEPDKAVGINTAVEDPEGNVDMLSLYNFAIDRDHSNAIPAGIVIAIKEPYYKITAGGGASLRCDHPTNIVHLDVEDPIVRQITWKSGTCNSADDKQKTLSSEEYKLEGNAFFKQGKYHNAITTYTRGVASNLSSSNVVTLRLNRAAALLKVERYEAALDDCRQVLECDVGNEKAIFRSAKAFYGLEEYEQALVKMQLYSKVAANKDEAHRELKNIRDRLFEKQRGIYDWNVMIAEAKKSATPRLDHASYVGPVRVANISNEKGRGLILTQNVCKGELLLCSKAFEICYPTETGTVIYINTETKLTDKGAQGMLASKIVQKLLNNPSLAKPFFDLYAGQHRLAKIPPTTSTPPVVDVFWVADICSMNSFEVTDSDLNPREDERNAFRYNHLTDSASGLFLMPSYINHTCLGNCIRSFVGDMMIVRALDDLPAGTELLMSYTDILLELEDRQSTIAKHGFTCDCKLCVLDRAESKDMRMRRQTAFQMFSSQTFTKFKNDPSGQLEERINETLSVINTIENTYEDSNRKEFQISLCLPLKVLGTMYVASGNTEKSIRTWKKILKIHEFGTKNAIWTVCLIPAIAELCLMYYMTAQTKLGQLLLEKLRAELTVTAAGDDRIFLVEHREVFERSCNFFP
ncbi:unnamed protein product [Didymodactylos carnosus]|uniref:SET domain-containing protein n=1 Tax=Didymodactylos carnosus TaxID=1234261 RepID=A0A815HHP1_9BILA|nr:unnamed protein product [Didymodactylos carnosus]CAF1395207.1 unnamed protein product [Didymodactylos carnosus]CAF4202570.1 unnamed protein product [Didymodactylos carnosus]CAF4223374.1 unnamed protein product [Didymodactylos carnosus]